MNVDADIQVVAEILPYVSKGGLKLEKGIMSFGFHLNNLTILDVGCSTGGFADCAIQHGAAFVYGIDVGSCQLDKTLQNHPQLKYMENLHVKDLSAEHLDNQKMDGIVMDISFISATQTFPYILPFLKEDGFIFILIKPQFELDSSSLNRQGIVQNPKHHQKAIQKVIFSAQKFGLFLHAMDYAPLMAYKKNIEYIALFRFVPSGFSINTDNLVTKAMTVKKEMRG